jgi:hypothetical protein
MNSGYIGYSMSVRAVEARRSGQLPATDLANWARRWFPGVTAADVAAVLSASSWHHTSKNFNATNFYRKTSLLEQAKRENLRDAIARRRGRQAKLVHADGVLLDFNGLVAAGSITRLGEWYSCGGCRRKVGRYVRAIARSAYEAERYAAAAAKEQRRADNRRAAQIRGAGQRAYNAVWKLAVADPAAQAEAAARAACTAGYHSAEYQALSVIMNAYEARAVAARQAAERNFQ